MTDGLKQAPPAVSASTLWAVLGSTAGVFIATSIARLVLQTPIEEAMSNARLLGVVGFEAAMALFWVPRLRRAGWSLLSVTEPGTPWDVLWGASLVLWSYLAYWLVFVLAGCLSPGFAQAAAAVKIGGDPSWWVVIVVSIVNPIAEEFLYLGFLANALHRKGMFLALSASLVVRILVHAYQGPLGLLGSLPIGGVLGAYYLRTGRLWPAVVAHSVMDLLALGALARGVS